MLAGRWFLCVVPDLVCFGEAYCDQSSAAKLCLEIDMF